MRFGLDGERYVEQINPLPEEGAENLILKTRTIGVHKRGSGASVEQEALIVGEDGTEYTRLISGSFLVGAKDFKDAGRTNVSLAEHKFGTVNAAGYVFEKH